MKPLDGGPSPRVSAKRPVVPGSDPTLILDVTSVHHGNANVESRVPARLAGVTSRGRSGPPFVTSFRPPPLDLAAPRS